jgi:iron complex transport system substrate-binding protein
LRVRSFLGVSLPLVAAVFMALILAACGPDDAASTAPRVLTDSSGTEVSLTGEIERIVSLAPSGTEILFAIGAGDRVVGVDDFSNYPPETSDIERIGSMTPNIERIVALEPDLVVAASISSTDIVEKLQSAGITVWVTDSPDVRGVADSIRALGAAVGLEQAANEVAAELEEQIERVVETVSGAASRPRVFHELDATDPTKPFTVGPGNFVHDLLTLAGGENVFADAPSPFPQVGFEEILARNPEAIVLADAPWGTTAASVKERNGWEALDAVASGWILEVTEDLGDQMSRPGPRIGLALEALARFLHPDLFA